MSAAIKIENVSKLYRLGTVGTGTLSHDLNRWWHSIRGKEDPYAKVGQVNDRTKAASDEKRETSEDTGDSSPLASRNSRLATSPDYVWALKDINLEVAQGEILGIIGRNGAGKSTLLKLLSRVTAPTTGAIKTKGRIASLLEVGTGFHPELTGRENIYLNGSILGMKRHEITKQLDEIVEFSGCAKYLDTPTKRYSSGMTVRLGFAVAAHLACEILIVDEVLAVGDADFQEKCLNRIRTITGAGRTVLFVSHNIGSIMRICSRCLLLKNGAIDSLGPTLEIASKYQCAPVEFNGGGAIHQLQSPPTIDKGVVVRGIQTLDLDKTAKAKVSTFDSFLLRLELDFLTPHEHTIDVAFQNSRGEQLGLICSHLMGASQFAGTNSADHLILINQLPLSADQYYLRVRIGCSGRVLYDNPREAILTVSPKDIYNSGSPPTKEWTTIAFDVGFTG